MWPMERTRLQATQQLVPFIFCCCARCGHRGPAQGLSLQHQLGLGLTDSHIQWTRVGRRLSNQTTRRAAGESRGALWSEAGAHLTRAVATIDATADTGSRPPMPCTALLSPKPSPNFPQTNRNFIKLQYKLKLLRYVQIRKPLKSVQIQTCRGRSGRFGRLTGDRTARRTQPGVGLAAAGTWQRAGQQQQYPYPSIHQTRSNFFFLFGPKIPPLNSQDRHRPRLRRPPPGGSGHAEPELHRPPRGALPRDRAQAAEGTGPAASEPPRGVLASLL